MTGAKTTATSADRPIRTAAEDRFARHPFAVALAKHIVGLPLGDSHVVALNGAWGTGKTSIVEMAVAELRTTHPGVVTLWFNPWMFTGVSSLLRQFFAELAAQLREKNVEILTQTADALGAYELRLSQGLTISLPETIEVALRQQWKKILGSGSSERESQSIYALRGNIEKLLADGSRQVVIVVDDIDRLPYGEIREVIRLVRLVADFPNTTYLLCYDKPIVEAALTESQSNGREYLKKIVQFSFDVPALRPQDLHRFMFEKLALATEGLLTGPFDEELWPTAFNSAIAPLVETIRDAKRVANAARFAVQTIGDEVALVDLLCLEATRLFLPDLWIRLPHFKNDITGTSDRAGRKGDVLGPLLDHAGTKRSVATELLRNIFPTSRQWIDNHIYDISSVKRWRRERKVAHEEVLDYYFERSLSADVLSTSLVNQIIGDLDESQRLSADVAKLTSAQLEALFSRLEDYQDKVPPNAVAIALPVLLNEASRMREGRRGMYDFGTDIVAGRLALRFLQVIVDRDERLTTVKEVLPKLRQYSRRRDLIDMVGSKEKVGHDLIRQDAADELEDGLAHEVARLTTSDLSAERGLFSLMGWLYLEHPDCFEQVAPRLHDIGPLVRLLAASLSETISQTIGSAAVRSEDSLPWDALTTLVGDGLGALVRAVDSDAMRETATERELRALEVAKKYAGGWRPDDGFQRRMQSATLSEPDLLSRLRSRSLAQRARSVTDLSSLSRNGTRLAPETIQQVGQLLLACDQPADLREQCLDLLVSAGSLQSVRFSLIKQWISDPSFDKKMSTRVSGAVSDHPESVVEIVEALQALPDGEILRAERQLVLQDVLVSLRTSLTGSGGSRPIEQVGRLTAQLERLSGNPSLLPLVATIRPVVAAGGED